MSTQWFNYARYASALVSVCVGIKTLATGHIDPFWSGLWFVLVGVSAGFDALISRALTEY